jgi:hypothetical protein
MNSFPQRLSLDMQICSVVYKWSAKKCTHFNRWHMLKDVNISLAESVHRGKVMFCKGEHHTFCEATLGVKKHIHTLYNKITLPIMVFVSQCYGIITYWQSVGGSGN